MRIDKLISEMGIASRKEASRVARSGGVLLNGKPIKDLSVHINEERDEITYLGRVINYKKFVYIMLNKPEGYVSATDDKNLPYVTELLTDELRRMELFPVGRLDKDTLGLMILTNNGTLAHRLLSPQHHVEKEYYFRAKEPLPMGVEEKFREGITLADGYECKEAKIVLDKDRASGYITLTEGKYHQIKRMLGALDNRIIYLERVRFGNIRLDTTLARGEWRELTADEESSLISSEGKK